MLLDIVIVIAQRIGTAITKYLPLKVQRAMKSIIMESINKYDRCSVNSIDSRSVLMNTLIYTVYIQKETEHKQHQQDADGGSIWRSIGSSYTSIHTVQCGYK